MARNFKNDVMDDLFFQNINSEEEKTPTTKENGDNIKKVNDIKKVKKINNIENISDIDDVEGDERKTQSPRNEKVVTTSSTKGKTKTVAKELTKSDDSEKVVEKVDDNNNVINVNKVNNVMNNNNISIVTKIDNVDSIKAIIKPYENEQSVGLAVNATINAMDYVRSESRRLGITIGEIISAIVAKNSGAELLTREGAADVMRECKQEKKKVARFVIPESLVSLFEENARKNMLTKTEYIYFLINREMKENE